MRKKPKSKKAKDQPRIIIWRNLVKLWFPMLHLSFKIIGCSVLEKIFKGHGGYLGHVTAPVSINSGLFVSWKLNM